LYSAHIQQEIKETDTTLTQCATTKVKVVFPWPNIIPEAALWPLAKATPFDPMCQRHVDTDIWKMYTAVGVTANESKREAAGMQYSVSKGG
jgi:hypothetical protein